MSPFLIIFVDGDGGCDCEDYGHQCNYREGVESVVVTSCDIKN